MSHHCLAHTRVEIHFFQALPGWLSLVPLGMLCLLLGNPWSVHADDAGVRWDQLGPAEQRVLRPHAERWDAMSDAERAAAKEKRSDKGGGRRERWESMGEEERAAAREKRGDRKGKHGERQQRHSGERSDQAESEQ